MGRRGRGNLFGEENPDLIDLPHRADPPDDAELAEDEILGSGGKDAARHAISNYKPPEKEKRVLSPEEKAKRDAKKEARAREMKERPMRDIAREQAAKTQRRRTEWWRKVWQGIVTPTPAQLEAARKLDEMAIDKTPTAHATQVMRPRILVGRVGESLRQGGDKVLPDKFEPYVAPTGNAGPAEDADD